jgi:hypothetical protein
MRRKKTARLAGGFSGILGVLRALTPLSIRQRSEIPKKVKIKFGGHGEIGRWSKRVSDFITRPSSADKPQGAKMRKIRILRLMRARSMRLLQN